MLKSPTTTGPTRKPMYPPLRRATYVTIDKLVNKQYTFDLNKLNEELFKIRTQTGDESPVIANAADEEKENATTASPAPTSHDTAGVANLKIDGNANAAEATATPNAWANPLSALPSSWQPSKVLPPQHFKFHTQSNRMQPPRDGFNLCVLVGKVDIVVDKFRVDGSRVLVAEVEVGDNSGTISLRARDEQIDLLKKVSADKGAVVLRNCTIELHQRKFLRLAVSKWGKMTAYPDGIASTPDPPLSMNHDKNYSLVDLTTVATAKDNTAPNQSTMTPQYPKFDPRQLHHNKQQHHRGYEDKRSPGYHQRSSNKKFQNQRRQPQPSMYSPQRQYYQQQLPSGPAGAPVFYPSYAGGDAGSVYSYQSHSTERSSPPPHGQRWSHHLPYQSEHYNQGQQQQLMYQQYELQQRHAHQMQMLQETQRRLMAVEQHCMGGSPQGINMVESHESNEDYSIPSTIAMGPPGGSFPPPPPPMGYPYSPPLSSPMRNVLLPGEPGGQQPGMEGATRNATVVSPPVSPQRFGHGPPPTGYGDPLLYFDQSSIPLTGMQEPDPDDEEQYDENIQF